MSDPNTIIYADAFGADALLDEGLPLAERRQALVALHRLLHGTRALDLEEPLPVAVLWRADDKYTATLFGPEGQAQLQRSGASAEEALAWLLAAWIGDLTRIIAERRIARAIELGRLATTVAATVKGAKAEGGHPKGLKGDGDG